MKLFEDWALLCNDILFFLAEKTPPKPFSWYDRNTRSMKNRSFKTTGARSGLTDFPPAIR
jgi:hypothetical protein